VSALTGLDAQFADGNVTLGVVLGAIGALTTVRALLPDPDASATRAREKVESPDSVEPFVALLLGAIALHDRLTTLVDAPAGHGSEAPAIHEREATAPRDGLLR
jgi:hypothetical protein